MLKIIFLNVMLITLSISSMGTQGLDGIFSSNDLSRAHLALKKSSYELNNIYAPADLSIELQNEFISDEYEKRKQAYKDAEIEYQKIKSKVNDNSEYENEELNKEFQAWIRTYNNKNLKISFPEIYEFTKKNDLNWHPQDGYWYLDDFFKGKLEENRVFPCLNYNDYKIHLMPKKEELQTTIIKFLEATYEDPALFDLVADFKFIKKFENFEKNEDYNMPIIIIYAASGKQNAQQLLDKVYSIFKNQEGINKLPRWNEKVTSLIYFAQGNGDQKMSNRYMKYFQEGDAKGNGRVYFKKDVTGTIKNYYLKNPANISE